MAKIEQLIKKLSKYGDVQVCKEGHVFTLLITGNNLDNWIIVNEIQMKVIEYAGKKYPFIEVLKNSKHFLCYILRK